MIAPDCGRSIRFCGRLLLSLLPVVLFLVVVLVAVMGVYGARTALAGRSLFRDELLSSSH